MAILELVCHTQYGKFQPLGQHFVHHSLCVLEIYRFTILSSPSFPRRVPSRLDQESKQHHCRWEYYNLRNENLISSEKVEFI